MTRTPDGTKSIDEAAAMLGMSVKRLVRLLDSIEWIVIQDFSVDVVPEQVESGNIVLRREGARITPQGMEALRLQIRPAAISDDQTPVAVCGVNSDTVPF